MMWTPRKGGGLRRFWGCYSPPREDTLPSSRSDLAVGYGNGSCSGDAEEADLARSYRDGKVPEGNVHDDTHQGTDTEAAYVERL